MARFVAEVTFKNDLQSFVCQVQDYRNTLKLSCRLLALSSYKAFLNNKKSSGTGLPASFSA